MTIISSGIRMGQIIDTNVKQSKCQIRKPPSPRLRPRGSAHVNLPPHNWHMDTVESARTSDNALFAGKLQRSAIAQGHFQSAATFHANRSQP